MIKAQVDLSQPRNLAIVALVLVSGIGNLSLTLGSVQLSGVGLCAVIAIVLNLILPRGKPDGYPSSENQANKG
ncbi:MAG: hypothetical protein B0D91_00045 [Oceanospirillales bacterium LUC14_002_19_P2]|nr:MAG: hypothetical protein B0D91_00045 [Oceanospirillales bacterium LUC14_002_19_P2]